MHWFWRATISILISCAMFSMLADAIELLLNGCKAWVLGFVLVFPALLLGFTIFGAMTRLRPPKNIDNETRCRKCGYILRGISEPRCPECGERI